MFYYAVKNGFQLWWSYTLSFKGEFYILALGPCDLHTVQLHHEITVCGQESTYRSPALKEGQRSPSLGLNIFEVCTVVYMLLNHRTH